MANEQVASYRATTAAIANATAAAAIGLFSTQLSVDDEKENAVLPRALDRDTLVTISKRLARYWTPAFCLDYDGTLAPLVADPAAARLPPGTRALLREIADRHPTAIVSGRSLEKPGSVADQVFMAQKSLFSGLSKATGDTRAEDRTGKLLRRVEITSCGVLWEGEHRRPLSYIKQNDFPSIGV